MSRKKAGMSATCRPIERGLRQTSVYVVIAIILILVFPALALFGHCGSNTQFPESSEVWTDDTFPDTRDGFIDDDFWADSSVFKLYTTTHSKQRTPVWDAGTGKISISMARNEYESFQLAFRPLRDITETITISQPTGPSVLGTRNITLREVAYAGSYSPDPLIPVGITDEGEVDVRTGEPSSLSWELFLDSGTTSSFWVTVYMPAHMPAGTYKSNITFSQPGGNVSRVLEVNVWDFVLPEHTTLETFFRTSPGSYLSYYPFDELDPEHVEFMKKVYSMFGYYRIAPGKLCTAEPWVEDVDIDSGHNVTVNFTRSDPLMEYYMDELNLARFEFPVTAFDPVGWDDPEYDFSAPPYLPSENYTKVLGQYVRKVADHYRERGWLDRCIFQYCDEPYAYTRDCTSPHKNPPYALQRAMNEIINESAPDLRHLITGTIDPPLYGAGDIWSVPFDQYHLCDTAERGQYGEKCWWRDVGGGIEDPGMLLRALYWDSYCQRVDGVTQWSVNSWGHSTVNGNPWLGSSEDGDGYMFYPGPAIGVDDDIIPSIRLELTRDGLEDYEYLVKYADIFGRESAEAVAVAVSAASEFSTSPNTDVSDFSLYRIRQYLAEAVEVTERTDAEMWRHCLNGTLGGPGPGENGGGDQYQMGGIEEIHGLVKNWAGDGKIRIALADASSLFSGFEDENEWSPDSDPSLNSSISAETGLETHTEGAAALNFSFRRNGDNVSGLRSAGVRYNYSGVTDFSEFGSIEFDCSPVGMSLNNFYLVLGFEEGNRTDRIGVHSLTGTLPGRWHRCSIDISGIPRTGLDFIRLFAYNRDLEVPFDEYSLIMDNMTIRKNALVESGHITFIPVDLGEEQTGRWYAETIGSWPSRGDTSISLFMSSSADGSEWGVFRQLEADHEEPFRHTGKWLPARYVRLRAVLESSDANDLFTPVLSEVRLWYEPVIRADIGIRADTFSVFPETPSGGQPMTVSVDISNSGDVSVGPVILNISALSENRKTTLVNRTVWLTPGITSIVEGNISLSAGDHTLSLFLSLPLEVADPDDSNELLLVPLHVNAPPVAVITGPSRWESHKVITLNASGSRDIDGNITSFAWDMGDGTVLGREGVEHTYLQKGVYNVVLTVVDDAGANASAIHVITLDDPVPEVEIMYSPIEGYVTTEFLLYASAFDPLKAVTGYSWKLPGGRERTGKEIIWTFTDDGPHNVSLDVSFAYTPYEISVWKHVFVHNLPPVASATASAYRIAPGQRISFSADGTTDADDLDAELSYRWDFGDGGASDEKNPGHFFNGTGTFAVNLTVTDDNGGANTTFLSIRVHSQPPVADFDVPEVYIYKTVRFDGSLSHDMDGKIVEYLWRLSGPGMNGSIEFDNISFDHVFNLTGNYTLNLTVLDSAGDHGYLERIFFVRERPDDPDVNDGESSSEGSLVWIVISIVFIFVLTVVVVFFVLRSRRMNKDAGPGYEQNEEEMELERQRRYEEVYGSSDKDGDGDEDEDKTGTGGADGVNGIAGDVQDRMDIMNGEKTRWMGQGGMKTEVSPPPFPDMRAPPGTGDENIDWGK